MKHKRVYLASASPRRRQLLEQIGVSYEVIKPDVDESRLDDVDPQAYTQRIAIAKALFANRVVENDKSELFPIVAADTAVVLEYHILGKPQNESDAFHMLNQLSDRTHQVYSSVCVIGADEPQLITQISDVTFRKICESEIKEYWSSGEPADKAGGYGIQGLGAKFVKYLSGSYSGVMGLPLYELLSLLDKTEL